TIIHPNGVVTLYSHLQSISVKAGEKVSQGQGIGLIGHTGQTIPSGPQGCHLHFEVRGAENPFAK
ncbi:M23 family metallopeptidase, partial [Patescibacteria group bacterium]|nr:M23 family metallopeptidase [Patescibacteria group bacterium]